MDVRKFWLPVMVLVAVALTTSGVQAIGWILGQSKEELKLKYDVTAADSGDGKVTVRLTIADEGRLKPLDSIDLGVPSQDKSGGYDINLQLAPQQIDGKIVVEAFLTNDLAHRAQFTLTTTHMDGKQLVERSHYIIPWAKHLPKADAKP